jgi:cytochrome c-type biogenesis protein CcsB
MSVFEWSEFLFSVSTVGYVISLLLFIFFLVSDKKWITEGAVWSLGITWGIHTLALLLRWYVSGLGHPPWSNLYESLVAFGWGVVTFSLGCIWYYGEKAKFTGLFAAAFTFLAIGMASLYHIQEIQPLVPALQSNWILFHVLNGVVSYSLFIIASVFAFCHLIRLDVDIRKMGIFFSILAFLFIWLVAGNELFTDGVWKKIAMIDMNGDVVPFKGKGPDGEDISKYATIPLGGPLLLGSVILYLLASAVWGASFKATEKAKVLTKSGENLFIAATLLMIAAVSSVFINAGKVVGELPNGLEYFLSPEGNPFRMGIIGLTIFFTVITTILFFYKSRVQSKLPESSVLDKLTYKLVLLGFPFQTLLLVTGAIWAYSAWGRYWGWDPKETWALITWFYFVVYLHLRMIAGWKGAKLATYAALGFGVVIFAFLGVNIALSGLHSYGAA